MNIIQQLWAEAQSFLDDMTRTQKMSVLVLIGIVGSLLAFSVKIGSQDSGDVGLVPLPIEVEPERVNEIITALESASLGPVEYQNGKILIPPKKVSRTVAFLAQEKLIPAEADKGFAEMLKEYIFTDTKVVTDQKIRVALQTEMGRMISSFGPINTATVVYSDTAKGLVFTPQIKKTASVTVRMQFGKKLTQPLADTVIQLVASAKAGLSPERVVVADEGGRIFRMRNPNAVDAMGQRGEDLKTAKSRQLQSKIEALLRAAVPNSNVEVFVEFLMNMDIKSERSNVPTGSIVRRVEKRNRNRNSTESPGGAPGVPANVERSANIGNSSAAASKVMTDVEKSSKIDNTVGSTVTDIRFAPKVEALTITAIVQMPQFEYELDEDFKPKYKTETKDGKEIPVLVDGKKVLMRKPPKALDIPNLRKQIRLAAGIWNEGDEKMKVDIVPVPYTAPLTPPEDEPTLMAIARDFLITKGTVLIVAGVLMMTLLFVRAQGKRSLRSEDLELPEALPTVPRQGVGITDSVSDQDKDFEKIRNQVGSVVDEDPRAAAGIVRRWIKRENF